MKLTKVQRRYLDAIFRTDWTQRNKDGKPAIRRWARENGLVEQGKFVSQVLTAKGKAVLDGKEEL